MTETMDTRATAPWYFWVASLLALLWNAFGGYDYTMSHLQGLAYFRQMGMTDAQIAYVDAYPTWMHAVWAIGVWGSVLGSILLVLRSRWAFHAFAVSLLGAVGNLGYLLMNPGGGDLVFPLIIIAICALLIWFSWTMTNRGVLR
jgi:hypothetical protein